MSNAPAGQNGPERAGGRHRKGAVDAAATALAAGKTVKEAAVAAGIGRRTLTRWQSEPVFSARVQALRGEMVSRAAGRLSDAMAEASDVLRALLTSGEDRVKLRAASEVLTQGLRVAELVELQRRVEELERRQTAAGGSSHEH